MMSGTAPMICAAVGAQALLRLGKHAEALAETRSLAVEGDAASVEVLAVRAEALYASGNMERAQRVYEEVWLSFRTRPSFELGAM